MPPVSGSPARRGGGCGRNREPGQGPWRHPALRRHDGPMDQDDVRRWVDAYERAWRGAGTSGLVGLFTDDATYRASPWQPPIEGLGAIGVFWEAERDGPDEEFTMVSRSWPSTARLRGRRPGGVRRSDPQRWTNLGCCGSGPTALPCLRGVAVPPDQPDGHEAALRRAARAGRCRRRRGSHRPRRSPGSAGRCAPAGRRPERGVLVLDHAEVLPGGVLASGLADARAQVLERGRGHGTACVGHHQDRSTLRQVYAEHQRLERLRGDATAGLRKIFASPGESRASSAGRSASPCR